MATDVRDEVRYSDEELLERFGARVHSAGLDDLVRELKIDFDDDADNQFALFVTAVLTAEAEQAHSTRLVSVPQVLHDVARSLGLPLPWYVRLQGEDARADDDPAA